MEYLPVRIVIDGLVPIGRENIDLIRMQLGYLFETYVGADLTVTDCKGKKIDIVVSDIVEAKFDEFVEM